MNYMDLAESPILYFLVGVFGIGGVLTITFLFLRKSWKRAGELGIEKAILMDVIKSTISVSVVPSLAIVIGFLSLAAMLGVPWPWFRLSVIGSVSYEILTSSMTLGFLGKDIADATPTDFTLIMFVMSLCATDALIFLSIVGKRIMKGTIRMKTKDPRWGALGNSTFMLTIVIVVLTITILSGGVTVLTLFTSAFLAVLLSIIAKREGMKWMHNFILAISLLGAMASSVLWTHLIG